MQAKEKRNQPIFVGAGFIALDMVLGMQRQEPRFYAGGTTGNVLSAMAFHGWRSIALGRLEQDGAGQFVQRDMAAHGVETLYLHCEPACPTPIVIQKIFEGRDGKPKHRFAWTCPDCGAYLPGYRALLTDTADRLITEIPRASVFFTDRVSRSSINLARHFRKAGAVIFFEPSTLGDPGLFVEMLQLADILKYSDQRGKSFSDFLPEHKAQLEIQTLGEEGLRFRLASRGRLGKWSSSAAYTAPVIDTAGAGDWTSAGLIAKSFPSGRESLRTLSKRKVQEGLEYGQALAALNCGYEGARGLMYSLRFDEVQSRILTIRSEKPDEAVSLGVDDNDKVQSSSSLCPACGDHSENGNVGGKPKPGSTKSALAVR
jgi:sugar/nucleoside kinase (ribokinase family)